MVENKQDKLARVFATLSSLRKNIDQMTVYNVLETYVHEFHSVLDRLEGIGKDVSEFRIQGSLIKPLITSKRMDGTRSYSEQKYVDKSYLLFKIDAILGYFKIITAEKPKRIGFTKSND